MRLLNSFSLARTETCWAELQLHMTDRNEVMHVDPAPPAMKPWCKVPRPRAAPDEVKKALQALRPKNKRARKRESRPERRRARAVAAGSGLGIAQALNVLRRNCGVDRGVSSSGSSSSGSSSSSSSNDDSSSSSDEAVPSDEDLRRQWKKEPAISGGKGHVNLGSRTVESIVDGAGNQVGQISVIDGRSAQSVSIKCTCPHGTHTRLVDMRRVPSIELVKQWLRSGWSKQKGAHMDAFDAAINLVPGDISAGQILIIFNSLIIYTNVGINLLSRASSFIKVLTPNASIFLCTPNGERFQASPAPATTDPPTHTTNTHTRPTTAHTNTHKQTPQGPWILQPGTDRK